MSLLCLPPGRVRGARERQRRDWRKRKGNGKKETTQYNRPSVECNKAWMVFATRGGTLETGRGGVVRKRVSGHGKKWSSEAESKRARLAPKLVRLLGVQDRACSGQSQKRRGL